MRAFFAHARGAVKRIQNGPHGGAIPFKIALPGGNITNAIVQQLAIESQGNYQFLHAVSSAIYVYVFGDRISNLTVGGTAFGAACDGGDGITAVLKRYSGMRIAVRGNPVTVGVGPDIAFSSFLTGINVSAADPETNLAQWALRFNFFPQAD